MRNTQTKADQRRIEMADLQTTINSMTNMKYAFPNQEVYCNTRIEKLQKRFTFLRNNPLSS